MSVGVVLLLLRWRLCLWFRLRGVLVVVLAMMRLLRICVLLVVSVLISGILCVVGGLMRRRVCVSCRLFCLLMPVPLLRMRSMRVFISRIRSCVITFVRLWLSPFGRVVWCLRPVVLCFCLRVLSVVALVVGVVRVGCVLVRLSVLVVLGLCLLVLLIRV